MGGVAEPDHEEELDLELVLETMQEDLIAFKGKLTKDDIDVDTISNIVNKETLARVETTLKKVKEDEM